MGLFIGLVLVAFGGGFFARGVAQARQGAWAGPRTSGMRQRASKGGGQQQRPVRHEIKLAWAQAKATDWLKQQDHDRKNGGQSQGGTPAAVGAARPPTPLQRAYASVRSRSGRNTATGNGTPGTVIPPAAQSRPSPAPQAPPQHVNTSASNGRTATVASNGSSGAAEKLIDGANQVHGEASTGGIHAKHGAIKAFTEGALRQSQTSQMLARAMSEPGSNYGPEITEPLGKAAEHFQAAAMALGEADTSIATLLNMTVSDLAQSSRQAPHHSELTESGSH